MNVGNILKVADAIENSTVPDLGFNMQYWREGGMPDHAGHACGTVACIGGWTEIVCKTRDAGKALGLDADQECNLFYPVQAKDAWWAKPEQAVSVLRNLAITGKVDWAAAMKPNEPAMPSLPSPAKVKQHDRA